MGAKLIKSENGKLTIELDMELNGSMLEMEEHIQEILNEAGLLATKTAMEKFDTNGEKIVYKNNKYTSRGKLKKK